MLYAYQNDQVLKGLTKWQLMLIRLQNLTLNCVWHNKEYMTINDREKMMTMNEQVMKGLTTSALRKSPLFPKLIAIWTACIFSANSQIAKISFVQLSEWQQKDRLASHRGLSSKSQFWRSQLQLLNLPQPLQFSRRLWMYSHHPCCHHLSETQLSPGVTDGCHRCQVLHINQSMMGFVWVRFP